LFDACLVGLLQALALTPVVPMPSIRTEIGRSLRLTYVVHMDADSRREWIQDLRTLLFLVAVWAGVVMMIVVAGMSLFSM
jgi:hypothetical protein